jgi:hypothetical protein
LPLKIDVKDREEKHIKLNEMGNSRLKKRVG